MKLGFKGLELDCLCRENNLLSVNLILVSAFGVTHLGNYSLIIEQSGINPKINLNESGLREIKINLVWEWFKLIYVKRF